MNEAPDEPARILPPLPDPDGVPTSVTRRHAAPTGAGSPAAVVVPLALGLVVVVALVGAWSTLQSRRSADAVPPAAAQQAPVTPPPGDAGTPAPTTSAPSPSASPTKTKKGDKAKPDPQLPRWTRTVPVGVLNATSRTGLAASVAAKLRAKGWTVVAAANWRAGNVHRTTIFTTRWPKAVRTLRHDVPGVKAVRAPLPQMSTDRIVLVLADDYPS